MQGYSKVPGDAIIGLKKIFLNSWEEPATSSKMWICGYKFPTVSFHRKHLSLIDDKLWLMTLQGTASILGGLTW